MLIRQETCKDYDEVYSLVKTSFASAEHSQGNEQDLVAALRKSDAFVPELSLVAEIDGKIAGHILFTKAKVGSDAALVLAPLSVLPGQRNKGVGGALINGATLLPKDWVTGIRWCWEVKPIIPASDIFPLSRWA